MEHKIGSTFKFFDSSIKKDVYLKVVKGLRCDGCYFKLEGKKCVSLGEECCREGREDGEDVKFVEVNMVITPKQIQARRRAFMIMQLSGMLTNLERMRDTDVRAWYLKGMINVCINSINLLLTRLKSFTNNNMYINSNNRDLLKAEKCETWHQLFNPN